MTNAENRRHFIWLVMQAELFVTMEILVQ